MLNSKKKGMMAFKPADPETQRLDQEDIARLMLIWELKEKMGVNDEAVPIILLHLIDQIHYLRLKINTATQKM